MKVPINSIKPNPSNPRVLKDWQYQKLKKSITEFPRMLELRPIVVDDDGIILGGNMRYRILQELKYKEVEIVRASELTEEEKKRFIIADNVSFGEWDNDVLANEWDVELLSDWGLDLEFDTNEPSYEDLIGGLKEKPPVIKVTFASQRQLQEAEKEIKNLIEDKYEGAFYSVTMGEL